MYRHRVNTGDSHYADQILPVPSQFKVGLRRPDADQLAKLKTYLYEFLKFAKLWDSQSGMIWKNRDDFSLKETQEVIDMTFTQENYFCYCNL